MDKKQIIIDYMYERALNDTRMFITMAEANKKFYKEKIEEETSVDNPRVASLWNGMLGVTDQNLQHLRTIEQHLSYIEELTTPEHNETCDSEDVKF